LEVRKLVPQEKSLEAIYDKLTRKVSSHYKIIGKYNGLPAAPCDHKNKGNASKHHCQIKELLPRNAAPSSRMREFELHCSP
jgi:hypothetical protein